MDNKIVLNREVVDKWQSGLSINDAIRAVFEEEINDRITENEKLKELSPLNLVMRDAGITKRDEMGKIMDTAYTSGGMESNEWLFPAFVETTMREALYGTDIIQYLTNTSISVDSNIVKSPSIDLKSDENKRAIKKMRVAEGADLPLAKIKIGEKAISLWKYGRAIEVTYEAMRRMRIDLVSKHLSAIANDIAFQTLDEAVDVLQNGDGNDNAATKLGTVASVATLDADTLVGLMMDYFMANHFAADTLVASPDIVKKLVGMTFDPSLSAGAATRLTFSTPQLANQNLNILFSAVPKIGGKDVIMLSNRSNTLTRYEENGSNIQEAQSFARNQTRLMTISENSGYAINMLGSNMYIEITGA